MKLQAAMGLGQEGLKPLQQLIDHPLCPDSIVAPGLRHLVSIAPTAAIPSLMAALEAGLLAVAGTNADEGQLALAPEQCGEVSLESARAPRRTTSSSA